MPDVNSWLSIAVLALATLCSTSPCSTPRSPDLRDDLRFVEAFRRELCSDAAAALELARARASEVAEDPDGRSRSIALDCQAEALAWTEGPASARALVGDRLERERDPSSLEAVTANLALARIYSLEGEYGSALGVLTDTREPVRRLGSKPLAFHHLELDYEARFETDALVDAEDLLAELRALSAVPELAYARACPLLLEQWTLYMEGRSEDSGALRDEGLALAQRTGNRMLESLLYYDAALVAWFDEDRERMIELARASRAAAERGVYLNLAGTASELVAQAMLELGRVDEAWAEFSELRASIEGRGLAALESLALELGRSVAAKRGDADALLELYRAEPLEMTAGETWRELLDVRGELARSNRESKEAEAALRSATRSALAGGFALTSVLLAVLIVAARRLRGTNARLAREIETSRAAEESRRASERKLEQVQRLESLGVVAGGVAHDFNNLLTGVLGNADLLLESRQLTGDLTRRAEAIREAGERGAELCQRLLVYAGKSPAFNDRVELNEMTTSLLPVLRTAAGSGVQLSFEPGAEEVWVPANSTRIDQVLLNLVSNATQAQAKRISVRVELSRAVLNPLEGTHPGGRAAEPGSEQVRDVAVLTVADDGYGMDAHVQEHLFEPFFTTRINGRGLGLAEVFGAVREVGGRIEVQSAPGSGSSFRVLLPTLSGAFDADTGVLFPHRPSDSTGELDATLRGTVLVVDDEPQVRELTCDFLRSFGMDAIGASNGEDALARLDALERPPSCMLVDMTMPGISGRELLERIRRSGRDLPMVLMSGHHQAEVLSRLAGTRTPVLSKPFKRHELRNAVTRAMVEASRQH